MGGLSFKYCSCLRSMKTWWLFAERLILQASSLTTEELVSILVLYLMFQWAICTRGFSRMLLTASFTLRIWHFSLLRCALFVSKFLTHTHKYGKHWKLIIVMVDWPLWMELVNGANGGIKLLRDLCSTVAAAKVFWYIFCPCPFTINVLKGYLHFPPTPGTRPSGVILIQTLNISANLSYCAQPLPWCRWMRRGRRCVPTTSAASLFWGRCLRPRLWRYVCQVDSSSFQCCLFSCWAFDFWLQLLTKLRNIIAWNSKKSAKNFLSFALH